MWLYIQLGKYGKLYPITYEPVKNYQYQLGYARTFDCVYANIQEREIAQVQV